jgi:hypothetical protein
MLGVAQTSVVISELISAGRPFLVARFGATEMKLLVNYYFSEVNRSVPGKWLDYILHGHQYQITEEMMQTAQICSGIFPAELRACHEFCKIYIDSALEIDLLASWLPGESLFVDKSKRIMSTSLPNIEPYYHECPWSIALSGRKVLVIHPFSESIRYQYSHHRQQLFENPDVLPEFELITYKSVQSLGGQTSRYGSWGEALEDMKNDIQKLEFDVAIVGCGAYGLPLASYIKKTMKKQAIHLGGATQILFGIKGLRWDRIEEVSRLYNQFWKRPFPNEIPQTSELFEAVEGGGYW